MFLYAPLTLVALQALSALAHPGHNDLLGKRELLEWEKRQAGLESCNGALAARHEARMERLHVRRSEILGRATPTGTAVTSILSTFPTNTASASPASSTKQTTAGACALSPTQVEGPYYIAGEALRSNLIDGEQGIPFYAEYAVIDTNTCGPLVGAAVDIWACNSTGEYGGFVTTDRAPYDTTKYNGLIQHVGDKNDAGVTITDPLTRLRGQQLTNSKGIAQFTTLIPGWYTGRTAHMHQRVHVGGTVTSNGTYIGGSITHTGQTFFGEDFYSKVVNVFPYTNDKNTRTTNAQDGILQQQNGQYGYWNLYYVSGTDITKGVIGFLTLAVDSKATGQ